jgi:PadR family transcriptional regulator, regulatory protein PadR
MYQPGRRTIFDVPSYLAYNAGLVYLGEFEQIVLLAILRLGDEAYAIPIREEIVNRIGRSVARGALYTALERLEAKRCVRSRMSSPLPERGGRSRRYFTVTPAGLSAVRSSRQSLLRLWQGLEGTLES